MGHVGKYCGPSAAEIAAELAKIKGTHLIEGCLEGGIEAYTIIDDTGTALFSPKPLSDLGFVGCCEETEGTLCTEDGKTQNCFSFQTCTVFQDFGGRNNSATASSTSTASSIQHVVNVGCSSFDGSILGPFTPNPVQAATGIVTDTILVDWINTQLGGLGFAAVVNPQAIPATGGSTSPYFMDLTFPTCAPWSFDILLGATHYSSSNPPFSGIRYSFDGTSLSVETLDASGTVIATPVYPTSGNIPSGIPLVQC